MIGIQVVFVIGCFSFFVEKNHSISQTIALGSVGEYQSQQFPTTKLTNTTNVNDNTTKRILLEAAHGAGFDGCNHASASVNGKMYYENLEARILIDKIAGYLQQAGLAVEISNELAGDSYFKNPDAWDQSGCSPASGSCCGFRQGTIGRFSKDLYNHIGTIGADKYILALELHFNGGGGSYSAVMVKEAQEPYLTNGKKITDAVDEVIGTTNSRVSTDRELFGTTLGTVTSLDRNRGIPTYYLETFFMDYPSHMQTYVNKKDELAKNIANAIAEIAGSEGITDGLKEDPFKNFPSLYSTANFDCRAIFVDKETGELNSLGELVKDTFNLIKWVSPVIALVLSILDYIKTSVSTDPYATMKKANIRTIKRLGIAIAVAFLPYLIDLLFHIFGLYDITSCNIT